MNIAIVASYLVLWLLVTIQGLAFLELIRQMAQIRSQLGPVGGARVVPGAIEAGRPVPELAGVRAINGSAASWADLLDHDLMLLIFLSTDCATCYSIAKDLSAYRRNIAGDAGIVAFVRGDESKVTEFITQTELEPHFVVVDQGGATAQRIGVSWNPAVVTLSGGRTGEAAILRGDVTELDSLIPTRRWKDVVNA